MPISPAPRFNTVSVQDRWRTAFDTPMSPWRDFAWQLEEGFLSSPGIGSVVRNAITPPGNTMPPPRTGVVPIDIVQDALNLPRTVRQLGETLFGQTEPSMTIEQYKASPSFRPEVPWEPGLTETRAAALAGALDLRQARQFFADKNPVVSFIGNFAGGMLDPINYVPVFGPAARAAAIAKLGGFGGHLLLNASEAAISTAAFDLMTAQDRAKYGYDVSWNATINDVAMSALFGAVVTPIIHGAAMAAPKVEAAIGTVKTYVQARSVLNDAVTSLATDGEVRLSPASGTTLERMAADVTAKREAATALSRETANVVGSRAGEVVISSSGARVAVRPEVVDISTLQRAVGDLQVRDRSRAASDAQIEEIAATLDPARLMPAVNAEAGAPLVGADNIVDSGNGRVAAISRVYDNPAYAAQADAYRKAIEEAGYPIPEGVTNPVLISRRLTELSPEARAQFNAEAQGSTSRMSSTELAAMDRGALDDATLRELADGPINSSENRAFVGRFMGNLPANERAALVDRNGNLNADGERRIENALVAAAYGDVDAGVVARFAEATDDNTRSVVGALSDVAGRWALMRRAAKAGEIDAALDMTPEVATALRKLSQWREQAANEGRPVPIVIKEGMAQLDMLDGEMSLEAKAFVRLFYKTDDFNRSAGRETIAGRLDFIIKEAEIAGRPSLFGDAEAADKLGILQHAVNDQPADLFASENPRERAVQSGGEGVGDATRANRGDAQQGDEVGAGGGYRTPADLKAAQPARTIEELYQVAPAHQEALGVEGERLAEQFNAEWRDPGVKDKATAAEKMKRKGYASTAQMTDIVRGGFVVDTPDTADSIIAGLRAKFDAVVDEGWQMTDAGYFDRKALVRFADGTVGEVQFWHPDMLSAKDERGGHSLYEKMRGLEPNSDEFKALVEQQRALYSEAVKSAGDAWLPVLSRLTRELEVGSTIPGNVAANASGVNLRPESTTSAASQGSQSAPGSRTNRAEPDAGNTAGLSSQSKNLMMSMSGSNVRRPATDMQAPAPELPPEGLSEAAARVGTVEDMKALAEQFGVDEAGAFPEQAEIDMLREMNDLTPEDVAELEAADQVVADADAYGKALMTAARCAFGT